MSKITSDLNILRGKSEPVVSVQEANSIILELSNELKRHKNGIGLSAIQIGIPKQISIIKYRNDNYYYIINPEIIKQENPFNFNGEGCLSFPNIFLKTNRYKDFVIKNKVIDCDIFREETHYFYYGDGNLDSDIEAIAVQHEIDHQYGILFFDKETKPPKPIIVGSKIGRNDPCFCNSGKKYKKCCGLI